MFRRIGLEWAFWGLALWTGVCAGAQEDLHGLKVREVHPAPTPTPFPLEPAAAEETTGRATALTFLTRDQMSAADRELVAANEAEIARRASLLGFSAGVAGSGRAEEEVAGRWGYEQAVCPVFPGYLVLEYSRDAGAGDVSLFSAVIPRGGGHVRVIPVRRKGFSLWTPSPSNALTIHDFNVLVKQSGLSPDWLTTGLCYAALAGGKARAAIQAEDAAAEEFPQYGAAILRVSRRGGAEVDFTNTAGKAMQWSLFFAQDGRLLKVKHSAAMELVAKPVRGSAEAAFPAEK